MSLTLLIDLDDTLLVNNIESFLPAYLKAFATWVSPTIDPGLFTESLLAATNQMVKNRSARVTLQEAFESAFYPLVQCEPEKFRCLADQFYAQVYPSLRQATHPKPGASEMVATAQARGYRLAIATNPLFPRSAIHQRLAWAGLPPDQYHFEVITSYESFHFSKPEPAYYAELLARLGWPAGPVVMVGDDWQADITPARCLGVPVYQIRPTSTSAANSLPIEVAGGTPAEVIPWLDQTPEAALTPVFNQPAGWLAILLSTPAALDHFRRTVPVEAWRQRPQPDEWCLAELICHWRDVDREVNLPRLQKILQSHHPFLAGMDTDPWATERDYFHQDFYQALEDFITTRQAIIDFLEQLAPDAWERSARHAILGRTSLAELVSIISSHDRLHIQQAHRTLKATAAR